MGDLRVSESIVPLSEFKAQAGRWLEKAGATGMPIVITQNGRAAGVLLSPAEYDRLTERARFAAAVNEGMSDIEAGRVVEHEALVAETTARYDAKND